MKTKDKEDNCIPALKAMKAKNKARTIVQDLNSSPSIAGNPDL